MCNLLTELLSTSGKQLFTLAWSNQPSLQRTFYNTFAVELLGSLLFLHNAHVSRSLHYYFLTVCTYCLCLVRHSYAIYCFHWVPKMWWGHNLCKFSYTCWLVLWFCHVLMSRDSFSSRQETLPSFSITQSHHTPNKHALLTGQSRISLRIF